MSVDKINLAVGTACASVGVCVGPELGVSAPVGAAGFAAESAAARTYQSFRAFKAAEGRAAHGFEWHHLVEQNAANIAKFGPNAIHSTDNLIQLEYRAHRQISGFYSSIQPFTNGGRVRDWLASQTFGEQMDFALLTLRRLGLQ